MIKSENKSVEIKGSALELLTDLALITKSLRDAVKEEIPEKDFDDILQMICEDTKKSEKQIAEEARELRKENAKKLLEKIIKDFFEGDDF